VTAVGGTPLVSVVTPVQDGGQFLADCIESVLRQTYTNFEFVIFDDASRDDSLAIARRFAQAHRCIRVEHSPVRLGVMESHNAAFRLMSPRAKYCKVVSPEDGLFPECLERMVEHAERNPSVAIVGGYQLLDTAVRWQGFEYPREVIPGREMCRRILLGTTPGFGFGTPTSVLYRADLVREADEFYPRAAPHSDATAAFSMLRTSDYGFVYRVLSYGRIHPELESLKSAKLGWNVGAYFRDLLAYGPIYLDRGELDRAVGRQLADYYRFLAARILRRHDREFWAYHERTLEELGYPLRGSRLAAAVAKKAVRELVHPAQMIRQCWRAVARRSARESIA
jgi:glycosyltransferase involved in cell wall biosynthesis